MPTTPTLRFGRDHQGRDRWALANCVCNPAPRCWTNHHCGNNKPRTVQAYIIRMLLANGYWAYRPERVESYYTRSGWVSVEWPYSSASFPHWFPPRGFWPYENYVKRAGGQPEQRPPVQHRRIKVEQLYGSCEGAWHTLCPKPAELQKRCGKKTPGNIRGTAVSAPRRNRVVVATTRCAASNRKRLQVTDDPVKDGRELVTTKDDKLPSDKWHLCPPRRRDAVSIVSREELELQRIRILLAGESDMCVEILLSDIIHDAPVYSVKLVAGKKRARKLTPPGSRPHRPLSAPE